MKTLKKLVSAVLGLAMLVSCMLTLSACNSDTGNAGASEVGTWMLSEIAFTAIPQGKLASIQSNTLTLYSDNTFVLVADNNAYYSSDNGETYNPTNQIMGIAYGKCEIVDENKELNEKTIKITSIDRIQYGDFDTSVDEVSDSAKDAFLTNSQAIGTELILGADHKLSDMVDAAACFYGVDGAEYTPG